MAYVERSMGDLSDDERYKILRGNALRMLNLSEDLPAG
jgi:predicted TIM-barrel fold metal-dependent hydrolase